MLLISDFHFLFQETVQGLTVRQIKALVQQVNELIPATQAEADQLLIKEFINIVLLYLLIPTLRQNFRDKKITENCTGFADSKCCI